MSSELAFNAYVFLPNAMNLIENRMQVDYSEQLGASKDEVAALHTKILIPQPNEMLEFIRHLSPAEKSLLIGCGTMCLGAMDDEELAALMGLPRNEMENVLQFVAETGEEA